METWLVGLDAWIIQDGNYPDFRVGQVAEFALEFGVTTPAAPADDERPRAELRPVRWTKETPASQRNDRSGAWALEDVPIYDFTGRVVRREPCVVDIGLLAYSDDEPIGDEGMVVTFAGYLGIDPFMYFEELAKDNSVPPLIYRWRIKRIGIQTAPWIEEEPRYFVRDTAKSAFADVVETNAWNDDDGSAQYVLECARLEQPPRRRSSTAVYV